eukprot:6198269-Pleurochrysis_carterae.AAC.6
MTTASLSASTLQQHHCPNGGLLPMAPANTCGVLQALWGADKLVDMLFHRTRLDMSAALTLWRCAFQATSARNCWDEGLAVGGLLQPVAKARRAKATGEVSCLQTPRSSPCTNGADGSTHWHPEQHGESVVDTRDVRAPQAVLALATAEAKLHETRGRLDAEMKRADLLDARVFELSEELAAMAAALETAEAAAAMAEGKAVRATAQAQAQAAAAAATEQQQQQQQQQQQERHLDDELRAAECAAATAAAREWQATAQAREREARELEARLAACADAEAKRHAAELVEAVATAKAEAEAAAKTKAEVGTKAAVTSAVEAAVTSAVAASRLEAEQAKEAA